VFRARLGFEDGRVNLLHDPDEHAAIDALHERVPDVSRLFHAHGTGHAFSTGDDRLGGQGVYQVLGMELGQSSSSEYEV